MSQWQGSHHQLAMQEAGPTSVLGDFSDTTFTASGVTSRFFTSNGKYFVNTDGPNGDLADYQIRYTFGVTPLQQYLIEFPDGRIQALSIAWDTRAASDGGQRWFHLYPNEQIDHTDELHWTRPQQNWNSMCADCHSTNVRKGYSAETDTFATTWSEVSVGCEACHGPAEKHLSWAAAPVEQQPEISNFGLDRLLDETSGIVWQPDAVTGTARRSQPNSSRQEIEICAACHSRRGIIKEGASQSAQFLDHYMPALLSAGLYYDDGQIRDEVYVWGSFLQSRMHAAGVTCSNCHEPHSQDLRADANAVCGQCHQPVKFASTEHHRHAENSTGAACVNCHMPETTYMVVDPRRDHSMRIPRPDLSVVSGAPNACTQCHLDRDTEWAARIFADWYPTPKEPFQNWGSIFAQARAGDPRSAPELVSLIQSSIAPDIARATAVVELAPYLDAETAVALQSALNDDSPLVRIAASRAVSNIPPSARLPYLAHMLQDDLLAVRSDAARSVAGVSQTQMNAAGAKLVDTAVAEYIETQQLNADRPQSQVNLGNLYLQLGESDAAERHYRAAIALEVDFVPAYINLADLYRGLNRDEDAVGVLRQGIVRRPDAAALQHALGLAMVRQGDAESALQALEIAARADPATARYSYVYGVALNSMGKRAQAITELQQAVDRSPNDRQVLFALAAFNRDAGNLDAARKWASRLRQLDPGEPAVQELWQSLR